MRGVVETDAGDRHAGRHLHDREDRVEPAGGGEAAGQRHADHGQLGVRGDRARQRGGDARAGDDHAQPAHRARSSSTRPRGRARGARTSRAPRARSRAPRARRRPSASAPCRSAEPITMPTQRRRRRRTPRAAPGPPRPALGSGTSEIPGVPPGGPPALWARRPCLPVWLMRRAAYAFGGRLREPSRGLDLGLAPHGVRPVASSACASIAARG